VTIVMYLKRISFAVAIIIVLVIGSFLINRECYFSGGMPGYYSECTCLGKERLDYDQTAVDGLRRTTCLGIITSRTCYLYQSSPAVPCDTLPPR
jgi:hypothetical protein